MVHRRPLAIRVLIYLPLTFMATLALLPLYWLLTGSIKPADTLLKFPPDIIPTGVTDDHLVKLFQLTDAGRWCLNSLLLASVVTIANVVFCSMAGYGFAKMRFPGNRALFWTCLCTMMVPAQVTVIPLFLMVRDAGLINTYLGIALPSLVTAFGIFLMKQFMQGIPTSLIEAARVDGCNEFMIFWRIIFPIAKPAVAVLAILSFTSNWNNFLWPMLVAIDYDLWTLPVGLAGLNDNFYKDYGLTMAGAAVAAIPMIVMFIALQRYFLKGLTVGAVKG
jgi:multiple sugar transport system permease protein